VTGGRTGRSGSGGRRTLPAAIALAALGPGAAAAQSATQPDGDAPARTATYELVLDVTWSAETAPLDFPADPHLSPVIAVTHTSRYALFRDGETASSGLELVAENGRSTTLLAELAEARRRGRVGGWVEGPALDLSPGRVALEIAATRDHPLLSLVTMLAPSPDWFTGIADVALIVDGDWIDAATAPLWIWDSGTDAGETYAAANSDRQPQESIRLLATPHVLGPDGLTPAGRAHLRRIVE